MTQLELLEKLARYQNNAAKAVDAGDLGRAHQNLKMTTIQLFENAGANKIFDLPTAVQLFLIFFRAGFYLENKVGEYAYRYQAIPGQLGNACHFQLKLSTKDASGYNPPLDAVIECASAAHQLLGEYAQTVIIQSREDRDIKVGRAYSKEDILFTYNESQYPIVKITNLSTSKTIDFAKPRIFDFKIFKDTLGQKNTIDSLQLLDTVINSMVDGT